MLIFTAALASPPPQHLAANELSVVAEVSLSGNLDQMVVSVVAPNRLATRTWRMTGLAQAGSERFRWTETLGYGPIDGSPVFITTVPQQVRDLLEATDYKYLIDLSVSVSSDNESGQSLGEFAAPDYVLAGPRGAVEVLPVATAMERYPYGLTRPPDPELAARLALLGDEEPVRVLAPSTGEQRAVERPEYADRPGRSTPNLPVDDDETRSVR